MMDTMKIRAVLSGETTEVKVLMQHPMESGWRKDDANETIAAHFIQLVTATLNGRTVLVAQWGSGISRNPYLTFRLKGARAGDRIAVEWVDNKGASNSIETAVVMA